jgi:hypothetical protein
VEETPSEVQAAVIAQVEKATDAVALASQVLKTGGLPANPTGNTSTEMLLAEALDALDTLIKGHKIPEAAIRMTISAELYAELRRYFPLAASAGAKSSSNTVTEANGLVWTQRVIEPIEEAGSPGPEFHLQATATDGTGNHFEIDPSRIVAGKKITAFQVKRILAKPDEWGNKVKFLSGKTSNGRRIQPRTLDAAKALAAADNNNKTEAA